MTNPAPSSPKRQPIPFGKYLLLDRINIGGMAEVWRGKMFGAGGFERLVAIKRILPNIAEDEEFISMFIDEAKISVQLTHANIAQIAELGNIGGSYFIAMEYIPGKDLRAIFDKSRKKGEPAPIPLTCYVVAKLCEGLDYAHRKKDGMGRDMNIVHRDISPQNVLISYEGEVKVIDFGIAKAAGKATKTQAGILKGKFGYMSPEQIRGLPLDRRSDVFAIGVVLYEMLTGERLFVGDSDFSVLEKVRKAEVLPPSTYNKRIPEALEKIVLKALAKEVEDRYQYANEVADDLQRFLITSDSIFSRKDLMQYMKSTFAEEVEREKMRLQEYAEIKPPDGMAAAAEMGFGATPGPQAAVPTQPLPPASAAPTAAPPRISTASNPAIPAPGQNTGSRRAPSLTNLPKLTAVAPMLSNISEDDGATMLVDSNSFKDENGNDGLAAIRARNAASQSAPAVDPEAENATVMRPEGFDTDTTLPPSMPPQRPSQANAPVLSPRRPSGPAPAVAPRTPSAPATPVLRAPTNPSNPTVPAAQPGGLAKNVKLYGAIGGALVCLLLVVGIVVFKGPGTGNLVIEGIPPEAKGKVQITIDNQNAPWPLDENGRPMPLFIRSELKAGSHVVIISGDGYDPWSGAADVKAGSELTQLKVDLKAHAVKGQLMVMLSPETAGLTINGEVVKKEGDNTNPWIGTVPANEALTIEASAKGFQKFATKATASTTDTTRVKATLSPAQFSLNVASEPDGAVIFVDGHEAGTTPSTIKVAVGTKQVMLQKKCYDTETVSVGAAGPGETQAVKGALKKQPGCR